MTVHPDDRPDPLEQPIRARVPEKVAGGCFSTGVIVMTAPTEFVLDFVQNLGRPHQIVARVVMPHNVLPQLVDALGRNMQLYRGRWGELPQPRTSPIQILAEGNPPKPADRSATGNPWTEPHTPAHSSESHSTAKPPDVPLPRAEHMQAEHGGEHGPHHDGASSEEGRKPEPSPIEPAHDVHSGGQSHSESGGVSQPGTPFPPPPPAGHGVRQATAQEIYDDLKIRDELLSGVYANAVMIGHGPHEFSFDFITNFYPHSAVSARVFLAAGQIPRLYDSLRGTWDQLRHRMNPPPPDLPPPGWVV